MKHSIFVTMFCGNNVDYYTPMMCSSEFTMQINRKHTRAIIIFINLLIYDLQSKD